MEIIEEQVIEQPQEQAPEQQVPQNNVPQEQPTNDDYISKAYNALKQKVGGFSKTPEEFRKLITTDDSYRANVYNAFKQKVQGFSKTQDEFNALIVPRIPQEQKKVITQPSTQPVSTSTNGVATQQPTNIPSQLGVNDGKKRGEFVTGDILSDPTTNEPYQIQNGEKVYSKLANSYEQFEGVLNVPQETSISNEINSIRQYNQQIKKSNEVINTPKSVTENRSAFVQNDLAIQEKKKNTDLLNQTVKAVAQKKGMEEDAAKTILAEIADTPEQVFKQQGNSEDDVIEQFKENPVGTKRQLNAYKWLYPLQGIAKQTLSGEEYNNFQRDLLALQGVDPNTGQNTPRDFSLMTRANAAKRDLIIKYTEGYEPEVRQKMLKAFSQDAATAYNGMIKGTQETLDESVPIPYLNNTQKLALKYKLDTDPESATRYEKLSVDPSTLTASEKLAWQKEARDLEATGLNLKMEGLSNDIANLVSKSKKQDLTPEEKQQYEQYNTMLDAAKGQLKSIYDNKNKTYQDINVHEQFLEQQDIGEQRNTGFNRFLMKVGTGADELVSGVGNLIASPFRSKEGNYKAQLAAMGSSMENEEITHIKPENSLEQGYDYVMDKDFKQQLEAIKNDKNLTDEQKRFARVDLINNNPEGFYKKPIDPKLNFSGNAIGNAMGDMIASLVPLFATEGLGTTLGMAKIPATFAAVTATAFEPNYVQAIEEGVKNPYLTGLVRTGVQAAFFAGIDGVSAIKKLYSPKTAIGSALSKMTDKEIEAAMSKIPQAARAVFSKFKEAAGVSNKLTLATTGAEVTNAALEGKLNDLDVVDMGKKALVEWAKNTLLFGVTGGAKDLLTKEYKGNLDTAKIAMFEAAARPNEFIAQLQKGEREGTLTPEQVEQATQNTLRANQVFENIEFLDSEGNPLSDKAARDLFSNKMKEIGIKEFLSKDIPTALRNKAELEAATLNAENDLIQTPKTKEQLNKLQTKIENKLDEEGLSDKDSIILKGQLEAVKNKLNEIDATEKSNTETTTESVEQKPTETQTGAIGEPIEVSETAKEDVEGVSGSALKDVVEHKQNIHEKFRKEFEGKGIPKEQVDGAIALMEARAKSWASEEKGRTPEQWYERIADVKNGEFETDNNNILYQVIDEINIFDSNDVSKAKDFIDRAFAATENVEEVKKVYKKLAIKYHPDKNNSSSATDIMQHLNNVNDKYILEKRTNTTTTTNSSWHSSDFMKDFEKKYQKEKEEKDRKNKEDYDYYTNEKNAPKRSFFDKLFGNETKESKKFSAYKDFKNKTEKAKTVYTERIKKADKRYNSIISDLGSSASELMSAGIEKNKEYLNAKTEYDKAIMSANFDFQKASMQFQDAKGALETLKDGRVVIHALESPDFSTMVHEIAHVFEGDLTTAEQKVVKDFGGSEPFARGFEKYLRDGKAPTSELKTLFDKFKEWLTNIYKTLKGSPIEKRVTPKIKQIFDRLLTEQKQATTQYTEAATPAKKESGGVSGSALKDVESTAKALKEAKYDDNKLPFSLDYLPQDHKAISEAYHKAKADGSNPTLVKAVEDLLGKAPTQYTEAATVQESEPFTKREQPKEPTKVELGQLKNFNDKLDKDANAAAEFEQFIEQEIPDAKVQGTTKSNATKPNAEVPTKEKTTEAARDGGNTTTTETGKSEAANKPSQETSVETDVDGGNKKPPKAPADNLTLGEEGGEDLTKMANAVNDTFVEGKYGVEALDKIIGKLEDTDLTKVYETVKDGILKGRIDAKEVRERVMTTKTGSEKDQAVLMYDLAQLKGKEKDLQQAIINEKNAEEKSKLQDKLIEVQNDILDNALANRNIGRSASSIFRLRQLWVNKDLDIVDMENQYMASKGISELSIEQRKEVKAAYNAIRESRVKLENAKKELDAAKEENAKLKIQNEQLEKLKSKATEQKKADRGKKVDETIAKSKERVDAAKENLRKLGGNLNAGFNPQVAIEIGKIAAEKVYQGVVKFEKLVKDIYDDIKDIFPDWTEEDVVNHLLTTKGQDGKLSPSLNSKQYLESKQKVDLSDETLKQKVKAYEAAQKEVALKQFEWAKERRVDVFKNKPLKERIIDSILRWQRFAVLSYPSTMVKLAAVVGQQLLFKPLKFGVQILASKILPKSITDKSPIWGDPKWSSISKYYSEFIKNFSLTNLKEQFSGVDTKELLYGRPLMYDEFQNSKGLLEIPGRSHGYIKSFIKNPEFAYAHEQQINYNISKMADINKEIISYQNKISEITNDNKKLLRAIDDIPTKIWDKLSDLAGKNHSDGIASAYESAKKNGDNKELVELVESNLFKNELDKLKEDYSNYDVTNEDVMERINKLSLEHAKWAIMMNDNKFVDKFRNWADAKGIMGALVRSEMPVIKIPVNYVSRAFAIKYGLMRAITGKGKWEDKENHFPSIISVIAKGGENLTDKQAEMLGKAVNLGSIGLGFLVLGYLNKNNVKENEDGSIDVNGVHISKNLVHSPELESFFSGVNIGHKMKDGDNFIEAMIESDWDIAKKNPFANMLKYGFLPNVAAAVLSKDKNKVSDKISDAVSKKVADMTIPGIVKQPAEWLDTESGKFNPMEKPVRRKPEGSKIERAVQTLEMGIPLLRENVPEYEPDSPIINYKDGGRKINDDEFKKYNELKEKKYKEFEKKLIEGKDKMNTVLDVKGNVVTKSLSEIDKEIETSKDKKVVALARKQKKAALTSIRERANEKAKEELFGKEEKDMDKIIQQRALRQARKTQNQEE